MLYDSGDWNGKILSFDCARCDSVHDMRLVYTLVYSLLYPRMKVTLCKTLAGKLFTTVRITEVTSACVLDSVARSASRKSSKSESSNFVGILAVCQRIVSSTLADDWNRVCRVLDASRSAGKLVFPRPSNASLTSALGIGVGTSSRSAYKRERFHRRIPDGLCSTQGGGNLSEKVKYSFQINHRGMVIVALVSRSRC